MSRPRPASMSTPFPSRTKARMIEIFPEGDGGALPPTSRSWEIGIRWHTGSYTAAWASPKLMVVYECIRTHVSQNHNNPLFDRGHYWRRVSPTGHSPEMQGSSSQALAVPSASAAVVATRHAHSSSVPTPSQSAAAPPQPIYTMVPAPTYASSGRRNSRSSHPYSTSSPPSPPAHYQLQTEATLFSAAPRGGVPVYAPESTPAQYGRGQGLGNEQFPPAQASFSFA